MQSSVSCPQSNSELDNNEIRSENLILEMKLGPLRKLRDNIFQKTRSICLHSFFPPRYIGKYVNGLIPAFAQWTNNTCLLATALYFTHIYIYIYIISAYLSVS